MDEDLIETLFYVLFPLLFFVQTHGLRSEANFSKLKKNK